MATDDSPAALRALAFARSHDWGCDASLSRDADGRETLINLCEAWSDGRIEYSAIPATIAACREFGGY